MFVCPFYRPYQCIMSYLLEHMQVRSNEATMNKRFNHSSFPNEQNFLLMVSFFGSTQVTGPLQKLQLSNIECEPSIVVGSQFRADPCCFFEALRRKKRFTCKSYRFTLYWSHWCKLTINKPVHICFIHALQNQNHYQGQSSSMTISKKDRRHYCQGIKGLVIYKEN